MDSSPVTSRSKGGRPCVTCTHPQRERIEQQVLSARSISRVSRHFAISADALGRHIRGHAAPAVREALATEETSLATTTMARLLNVADDARNIRAAAMEDGYTAAALKAGDAEVRALSSLVTRFGIEAEVAAEVASAQSLQTMARALASVVRDRPDVGLAVAAAMHEEGDTSGADTVRALAMSVRRKQETS